MPDYSHLSTPIAETRYVLAAHYLEQCLGIVEVGGHKLHQHMTSGNLANSRVFWNIDPSAEQEVWNRVRTYAMPVTAFNFNHALSRVTAKAGLCLMGLEMYDEAYGLGSGIESVEHLAKNLTHFSVVVIDFVPENVVARMQALILLGAAQAVGLNRTIALETRWQEDRKYSVKNDSFHKLRNLWVLERQ